MLRRHRSLSHNYAATESDVDALALRIRRLVQHKGFNRDEIASPLLRRLTPSREAFGGMVDTGLRRRIKDAQLDSVEARYLLQNVEAELDVARVRLT